MSFSPSYNNKFLLVTLSGGGCLFPQLKLKKLAMFFWLGSGFMDSIFEYYKTICKLYQTSPFTKKGYFIFAYKNSFLYLNLPFIPKLQSTCLFSL